MYLLEASNKVIRTPSVPSTAFSILHATMTPEALHKDIMNLQDSAMYNIYLFVREMYLKMPELSM